MEVQQFEQAILKMAFETDAKITTASVAYYLGIPSRKANDLLNTLLEQGVLELDSDDEGNLFYFLPNQRQHGAGGLLGADDLDDSWEALEAAADAAAQGGTADVDKDQSTDKQKPSPFADHLSTTIDDEGSTPFSPNEFSPHQGADGRKGADSHTADQEFGSGYGGQSGYGDFRSPTTPSSNRFGDNRFTDDDWFQPQQPYAPSQRPSSYRGAQRSRFQGIPDGITSRLGRPDARPSRCGDNSVVVDNRASCESRPLADARPTITSCNDVDTANFSTHQDYGGFGFTAPSSSTALATTSQSGDLALTADGHHIEQPEHQPGMALLLSLILCGTGQIYNGEVSKGIIMLILCFLLWFVFLGWVVHIWSIVDAVVVAERINRKSTSNG